MSHKAYEILALAILAGLCLGPLGHAAFKLMQCHTRQPTLEKLLGLACAPKQQ